MAYQDNIPHAVIRGSGHGDNTVEINGWPVPMVTSIQVVSQPMDVTHLRLEIIALVDYKDVVPEPRSESSEK